MISQPSDVRTSTQGVLPPYRTVCGPGVGIDPRVPQNWIRRLMAPCSREQCREQEPMMKGRLSPRCGDGRHFPSDLHLRALLQCHAVADRDLPPLDANESLVLELPHRAGDGL